MKNLKTLALIPARGGSKGVPGKNYKMFNNKPLIFWTMNFVRSLEFIDYSIISSDSTEIEKIAKANDFNFLKRPYKISKDTSMTEECVEHTLKTLFKKKLKFDLVLLFEPTLPLRKKETILRIYKFFKQKKINSIHTISRLDKFIGSIHNEKFVSIGPNVKRRRQERNRLFYESGVVYIFSVSSFMKKKKIVSKDSFPYEVDELESLDINSSLDFDILEFVHSKLLNKT